jgi:hypothetical protein
LDHATLVDSASSIYAAPLVPVYHIQESDVAEEAEAVSHVVEHVAERLRRLASAYGEWHKFDAPAYFDLSSGQARSLVKVTERVSTVHVLFFVDLLLPSFQTAAAYAVETFAHGYLQARQEPVLIEQFYRCTQPMLVNYWQQLNKVIHQARAMLANDLGFLALNGAQEERERWRTSWSYQPPSGLAAELTPHLDDVSTLTLSFDFPLPAHRQPGRLRRLRGNRERRRARRIQNS